MKTLTPNPSPKGRGGRAASSSKSASTKKTLTRNPSPKRPKTLTPNPSPKGRGGRATSSKSASTRKKTAALWRLAQPADDDVVVAFSQALYREDPGSRRIVGRDVRRTLAAFRAAPARGACVVAVDADGAVVGYAFLCAFWSNELGGTVCTLDELYIAPLSRSGGRVTALVEGLVRRRWPFFADAVAMELEVTPTNTRARALYDRLGFVSRKNATLRRVLARRPADS